MLQEHWYRRTWLSRALLPLALLFGVLVRLRRAAYRHGLCAQRRLPVPVIVVGNLSVGGTGKTPLVIYLARALRLRGYRPGVVSRGYGAQVGAPRPVHADSDPLAVGDEPLLIARRSACPVWVSPARAAAAQALLAHETCDLLLSDDGLQHYALARTLEIAVLDARRRLGNGWLLPAGPLREPPARLEEVDLVVINGAGEAGRLGFELVLEQVVNLRDGSERALEAFAGYRVHAVAAIGDPERFFGRLEAAGLQCVRHPFADHHPFTAADLEFGDGLPVLMTEKDAVKCERFAQAHHWAVPVSVRDPDERILTELLQRLTETRT